MCPFRVFIYLNKTSTKYCIGTAVNVNLNTLIQKQCKNTILSKNADKILFCHFTEEKLFSVDEKEMDTVANYIIHYNLANLIQDVLYIELTYACNWGLFFPYQQACSDINCNKRVCWNALVSTYVPHHPEYSVCTKREKPKM